MAERRSILELWRSRTDDSATLVTLVRLEGSSYRRPGARLYIHSGGYVGSISGGCLEGEIVRRSAWLTRAGAAVETYSTVFDDIHEIPYGLGCGGVLDLLLEPANSPEGAALLEAFEGAQRGETCYCATILPSRELTLSSNGASGFARVVAHQDGTICFGSAMLDAATQAELARLAQNATHPEAISFTIGDQAHAVFVEPILPPQRLVVFGAGDDARPLVSMAYALGWRVAVADGRGSLAQTERFPLAEQVVRLSDGAANLDELHLDERDAVAILTHSFDQDLALLPKLLPLDLRYVGLLGSRNRSQLLLHETAQKLGWTPEQCLRRVRAPIGLDLGGDDPEAVALTILAEIQSILHGKPVHSRKMTEAELKTAPERPYVPAVCPLD